MRTHWWAALLVMSACTTQGVDRARRWPAHRKEGDARFTELERRNTELEQKNAVLEARVKKLEEWVSRVKVKPAADPPAADATPASAAP